MAPRSRKGKKKYASSGSGGGSAKWEIAANALIQNLQAFVEDDSKWNDESIEQSLALLESKLHKLESVQKPSSVPADDPVIPARTEQDFAAFETWLKDRHDIDLKDQLNLRIARVEGDIDNWTLAATETIPAGKQIVSVPQTALISTAQVNDLGLVPIAKVARDPSVILALVLLAHALNKNKTKSQFTPYVRVLPNSFTTPFWNFRAKTLLAMRPSYAFVRAVNTMRSLVRRYATLYTALRQMNLPSLPIVEFTFYRYIWSVQVVMTRQNEIPTNPKVLALVPVWDLCNHAQGMHSTSVALMPNTNEVFVESNAMREFKEGEHVEIFYGTRPNTELLLFSGFIQPDNVHDVLPIPLKLRRTDPLHPLKLRVLQKASVAVFPLAADEGDVRPGEKADHWEMKINANMGGKVGDDGLGVARVIVMEKDALATFLRAKTILPTKSLTEPKVNKDAFKLVEEAAKLMLAEYEAQERKDTKLKEKNMNDDVQDTELIEVQKKLIHQLHEQETKLLKGVIDVHKS